MSFRLRAVYWPPIAGSGVALSSLGLPLKGMRLKGIP